MGIAFSDGRVGFGTCDRVIVGHWRAPFSRERLHALSTLAHGLHARHGTNVGMLGVFESDAIELAALSDEGLRREAARIQAELGEKVRGGQSIVLEGNGFTVAALRGAALTLQSLSRAKERPVFHSTAPEGIAWLADRLALPHTIAGEVSTLLLALRARHSPNELRP